MKKKLLLFVILVILSNLTLANAFIIKSNQAIQTTKGATTFTFELKNVNGSSALLDKTDYHYKTGESVTYTLWYTPPDCLIKTERGCHLQLIDVYSSDNKGYVVLKDNDINEEVTLSVILNQVIISNIYIFDEPPNLFQRVNSYGTLLSWCPEEVSFSTIKQKLALIQSVIKVDISGDEINKMISECNEKDTFTIMGKPINRVIDDCTRYLDTLLRDNPNVEYSKEDLLEECEIRNYFNERFNEETVADYNQSFFDDLFKGRDSEFIKKIIYQHEQREVNREENETIAIPESKDLDVKNTSVNLFSNINEIRYIDTTEVILEKLPEFQKKEPLIVEKETTRENIFIRLLKKIFGFLPWF